MLEVLRGELEREFDAEGIRRIAECYLGLPLPESAGTTPAELSAALVTHCQRAGAIDALMDVMTVERPVLTRRLIRLSERRTTEREQLAHGDHLGAYVIESLLGAGSFSCVYRARSREREVRLRVLGESGGSALLGLQRYLACTRLAGELSDRWLPRGVQVEKVGERCLISHDFFPGEPLAMREPRQYSLRRAWPILRRVLQGLSVLHRRGLAHGALHAKNLLVSDDEESPSVLLLDAGAHFLRAGALELAHSRSASSAHLVAWAAPEQLLGDTATPASDVYAFGQLCHYLLMGRLPVSPDDPDFVRRRLTAEPDPLGFYLPHARLPAELEEIVMRLVDGRPERRPHDAMETLELMTAVVDALPLTPSSVPDIDIDAELENLLREPDNEAVAAILEGSIERGASPHRIADAFVLAAEQTAATDAGQKAKRRLQIRAGAIYENLAADPRAAERAYRSVLADDKGAVGAWTALERVLRRLGEHERLVEALVERRESLSDRVERAALLVRLGKVLSVDLLDEEQALIAWSEAIAEDPANDEAAAGLEQLCAGERSRWGGVLKQLSERANEEPEPARRIALSFRLGGWYESGFGRADLALQCYRAVVTLEPTHERALERMTDIYRRAQLWPELSQALLVRARATLVPAESRDLSTEAARVLLEHGGGEAAPREILEQVLSDDPSHAGAQGLLGRIHLKAGRIQDWARLMELRAEAATGDERRAILLEVARVLVDQGGDDGAAIQAWQAVLEESTHDLEALQSLTALYRKTGKHRKAAETLELELQVALTGRQRVALLAELARLQETELFDERHAAEAWERVLDVDSDDSAALAALCRLYRSLRSWSELAFTLERQAERTDDLDLRRDTLLELGRVAQTELGDLGRALGAYEEALALDPTNHEALDARAKLSAARGDAEGAALTLDALAEAEEAPIRRAERWLEAAALWFAQGDTTAAAERCRRALSEQPGYPVAALYLADLLVGEDEVNAAVAGLEHALGRAEAGHDKAVLGASLARVVLDSQNDSGRARAAVTLALSNDPQNALAHLIAAELDRAHARPELADEHYTNAARHIEQLSAALQVRLFGAHATVLAGLGQVEAARALRARLSESFADDRVALETAARVASLVDPPELAITVIDRLLALHEAHLSRPALASALTNKGELCRRLGQWPAAVAALERAASLDPEAVAPLSALAEVQREAGLVDALPTTLERLCACAIVARDAEACVLAGDIADTVLDRKDTAAQAYMSGLELSPDERKILLRLLRLYSDGHDWRPLIDVLMRLAGLTSDRAERARYVQTAARLTETELGDKAEAAALYEVAAKLDPNGEAITSRLLALYGELGDTESLRRILERQIARASASQDRERAYRLATALADLDLESLQVDDAIAVNEAALRLVAGDPAREAVLADLYLTDAKRYFHSAAALQRSVIARDPEQPEAYRRLHQLGIAAERLDTAWCAAQALTLTGGANQDEEEFYRSKRDKSMIGAEVRISDRDWADHLVHPDANPTLTGLLLQIQPVVAKTSLGVSLRDLGLDESAAIDSTRAGGTLVRAFESAADVLRAPVPLLFERESARLAVTLGRGARAHVILSSSAARGSMPERKAAFLAASSVVLLRPGYLLRVLLSPSELKAWVLGGLSLAAPKLPIPDELEKPVHATREHLRRNLPDELRRRISGILEQLLQAGGHADLGSWTRGVDLTADRAGLLFSGDLETALTTIRASGDSALSVSASERARALLTYAVSGQYLSLRNRLHLSIDRVDLEELGEDDLVPASRA
ncbi:MAG: tetratricopeptide repeat protein [Myxococcales bacterium]|nr:tetratricopeptide repeat protein [Myxococcales bacterium]